MRLDEVEAKSGFKRVHIYSLMKKGEFPQALRLGVRAVDWDSTEADVWKIARRSGLGVDVVSDDAVPGPRPVLDNDYEIRPCQCEGNEDPARNKADAERQARLEPELG